MRILLLSAALILGACQSEPVTEAIAVDNPDIRAFVEAQIGDQFDALSKEDVLQRASEAPLEARRRYLSVLRGAIAVGGVDRDYVTNDMLTKLAQSRNRISGEILVMDLDGDGDVSAAEFEVKQSKSRTDAAKRAQLEYLAIDLNEDAVMSDDEIRAFANRKLIENQTNRRSGPDLLIEIFAFDTDQDGTVTVDEVTNWVNDLPTENRPELQEGKCSLPLPSDEAEIIALSVYGAETLSSVAIGDEDNEVQYTRIEIEPGERPVYLIASSYEAMIWHFSGATDRIEHFAVTSSVSSGNVVGAIGLQESQLSLQDNNQCISRFKSGGEARERQVKLSVVDVLGRQADHAVLGSLPGVFLLNDDVSSGSSGYERFFGDQPENVSRATWQSFEIFNSGGVARLDPAEVAATHPVTTYSVLPQQAGLVQLEQEGKIKLLAGGAVGGTYLLLEPIGRWPTGLAGSHSVQFIVPRHIPVPVGYRGHSGVYAEATGTCSSHFGLCSQISDGVFDQALKDAAPAASQD